MRKYVVKNKNILFGESLQMVMINDYMVTSYSDEPLNQNLESGHEHYMDANIST